MTFKKMNFIHVHGYLTFEGKERESKLVPIDGGFVSMSGCAVVCQEILSYKVVYVYHALYLAMFLIMVLVKTPFTNYKKSR